MLSINRHRSTLSSWTLHHTPYNILCHSQRLKSEHLEQLYLQIAHFLISDSSNNNNHRNLQRNNCNGVIKNNQHHRQLRRSVKCKVVGVSAAVETTTTMINLALDMVVLFPHLTIQKRPRMSSVRAHLP